mgnify:CR=1 FL=1
MKKVLIIQTAFLGDVILTTPLIKKIKKKYEDVEISFVATPSGKSILTGNPRLKQIISFDKHKTESSFRALFKKGKQLRKENFDTVFLPHRSFRSSLLGFLTRAPKRIGYYESAGSFFHTDRVVWNKNKHEVERILDLLEHIDGTTEPCSPELFPSQEDYRKVYAELKDIYREPFGWKVVLAPGSTWATKRYPPIYFAEVGTLLLEAGVRYILIIGGKRDRRLCQEIKEQIGDNAINVAGKFTPLQSTALISACSVLVGNDSAPAHMASAMGIPTVVIYGPTVPGFGFKPFGKLTRVVELKELRCRPCSSHGPRVCPLGHHMCLRNIQPAKVADAALDLIAKKFFYLRTSPELFKFPPPPPY